MNAFRSLRSGAPLEVVETVEFWGDGEKQAFLTRAARSQDLNHPCLARLADFGVLRGRGYRVWETPPVHARPLAFCLEQLSSQQREDIARDLLEAVGYLHANRFVHGNINGASVFYAPGARPILFGWQPTSSEVSEADERSDLEALILSLAAEAPAQE